MQQNAIILYEFILSKSETKGKAMFEGNNMIIIVGISAGILGLLLGFLIVWLKAPSMMMLEDQSRLNFDETLDAIVKQAEDLNWKVPQLHQIHASMEKAGVGKVLRATVIEICKPEYAVELLKRDDTRIVVSLMPCRIGVYEKSDGSVIISRMNTGLMSKMFGKLVAKVMEKASSDSETISTVDMKK